MTRVLVVGLGVSGAEVARVLSAKGAGVLASDAGPVDPGLRASLEASGVEVESDGHERARAELGSFDLAFASPGISPLRGFLSEVVASGVHIASELDLAMELTGAPVVAVTGTNGKTTVCRLAEGIGRAAGLDVYACGNLETKFITAAHEHPGADAFVVEASSFSLHFARRFRPRVAIVTSLSPDHLDWHGTFDHYRAAKARIAANQGSGDLFLFPREQPEIETFAPAPGPARAPFGAQPLERGAWAGRDGIRVRLDGLALDAAGVERIWDRGPHFAADAAAASAAMATLGATSTAVEEALGTFSFDAHRLEPVGVRDGVMFVDDSVATNPHATLAAIAAVGGPVVLICGGRNKGIDLSPLRSAADRLRSVVAVGEAADPIATVFESSDVFVGIAGSIGEAVGMAVDASNPGDTVLLSPACASHDMFRNYAERGEAFRAACIDAGVVQP